MARVPWSMPEPAICQCEGDSIRVLVEGAQGAAQHRQNYELWYAGVRLIVGLMGDKNALVLLQETLMQALSSIVVGVDFSECSRVALAHALRIAAWSGAALHPVHVVEVTTLDYVAHDAPVGSLQQQIHAGLVDEATRRWHAFSELIPGAAGLPIDVLIGSRLAGIREQLVLHDADLLVLGAFGASKPNVGLGTVASGCIRGVPVDVLVVRDNLREAFRTVAVGIDFSEDCRGALESAAYLAHKEGARLFVVHVAADNLDTYSRIRRDLQPQLETFVAIATERYPALDVRCHVYPYSGHRSGILEFATLVNADVVVIGTTGRTKLRDIVLGSTAEKVLRDSVVAVWAAKPAIARARSTLHQS